MSWTQSYLYDAYNRLDVASEAGSWSQDHVYDRVGNRALLQGSYAPAPTMSPFVSAGTEAAVVSVFPNNQWSGNGYDAAGNVGQLLAQSGQSYQYDAENRKVQASVPDPQGGTPVVMAYDAMGQLAAEYGGVGGARTRWGARGW